MDSLITAAARALAAGDPLGALNRVALRDDATALALRGIAMAQLGAKALVRSAARAFGPKEAAARAALARAERAARHARIPALTAEVESASLVLNTAAARLIASGEETLPPARGGRGVAGVESARRGRVPSCRA